MAAISQAAIAAPTGWRPGIRRTLDRLCRSGAEGNHAESAEVRRLEPVLLGRDPLCREALWQAMYDGGIGYKGGPVTMSAIK